MKKEKNTKRDPIKDQVQDWKRELGLVLGELYKGTDHKPIHQSKAERRAARRAKRKVERDVIETSNTPHPGSDQIRINTEQVGLFNASNRRLQLFDSHGQDLDIERMRAAFNAKTNWKGAYPAYRLILCGDTLLGPKGSFLPESGTIQVTKYGLLLEATTEREVQ